MAAWARMENSWNISFSSIRSTPRAFRKSAPSGEVTHTVSLPSSSFHSEAFHSRKGMEAGLSWATNSESNPVASFTSCSTAAFSAG